MRKVLTIPESYPDSALSLALDTIAKEKQALVFCNTKKGAESQAEKIAQKTKITAAERDIFAQLADDIIAAIPTPTKQCHRLATCIKHGVAFHHSGLNSKQREIVETRFRDGTLKIICATPTLAMGMDLPAYRSIIRDLKRYTQGTTWGMVDIPVLEYEQMSGRAGRPGKEDKGEAICIAASESEKEKIIDKYLLGNPEDIYSKLAVEPVLRMYVLSLIASGYVRDTASLYEFFDQTFYAWQYGDTDKLHSILDKMTGLLVEWDFVEAASHVVDYFVPADELSNGSLRATQLGERVAQLYLDPYTAHHLLDALEKGVQKKLLLQEFSLLHLLATTLELRPLLNVKRAELDSMDKTALEEEDHLFVSAPNGYSHEYEEFLQMIKTASCLQLWISETGEDVLLETYGVTPGNLQAKIAIADWLLYSLVELTKLKGWKNMITDFEKMRVRLAYGAKEELLALLRLKGVGRIRARKLYHNGVKSIDDLKKAEASTLKLLVGEKTAVHLKDQVGQKVDASELSVKPNKRKGQINLHDYGEKK